MTISANRTGRFEDLSIVLQGPANLGERPTARLAAQSARRCFPGAEVIVSCWEGDRTDDIGAAVDQIVVSPDPGPQPFADGQLNVNRQIVSSRAGAKAANRPYVLKARSDLVFRNARLWSAYISSQERFKSRTGRDPILITNLTSVNPRLGGRYFALCDWIYLGLNQSVSDLFDLPLFPEAYLTFFHRGQLTTRYNAEQWIAINYLARHGLDLSTFPNGFVINPAVAQAHHDIVGSHFAMKSWFGIGVRTQKHRISSFSLDRMYTDREWKEEFFQDRIFFDPERLAVSAAYHSVVRKLARRLKRARGA